MQEPLVSIVIPVYNGADFLGQAIESALSQTYGNIEVIVVDDGSNDGGTTGAVAASFAGRTVYLQKDNGGVASALNAGIAAAKGRYFSWLSHDDTYYPWKVEAQVEQLRQLADDDCVGYGAFDLMNRRSRVFAHVGTPVDPQRFRFRLIVSSPVHGCTVLAPLHLLRDLGGFREDLRTTQDYDLWFRMAARARFVYLDRPLVKSRIHEGQGTRRMASIVARECDEMVVSLLRQMSACEVAQAAGTSPAKAYTALAASFRSRGYAGASRYLRERSPEFFGGRARAAAGPLRTELSGGPRRL